MNKEREEMEKGTKSQAQSPNSTLKYCSLVILVLQNASLILTIRYSRTLPGDMYISSTAVVFSEVNISIFLLLLIYLTSVVICSNARVAC